MEQMDRTIADFMNEVERAEQDETGKYKLPVSMRNELKRKDKDFQRIGGIGRITCKEGPLLRTRGSIHAESPIHLAVIQCPGGFDKDTPG
jgi:hypothetical protein